MKAPFLFLAATAVAGCSVQSQPAADAPYAATAVGRVDSADEARRLVAEVDGVIDRVNVVRGQAVTAGQVLLTIACGPRAGEAVVARAAVTEAAAQASTVIQGPRAEEVEAARNQVRAAEAEVREQRQLDAQGRPLLAQGFLSRREAESRANRLAAAEARLAESNARLRLLANGSRRSDIAAARAATRVAEGQARRAQAQLDQCQLRSPVAGRVLAILKREGEASGASAGEPVIIVGGTDRLIVRAEIDERDAAAVREGQRAEIWIAGGQRWRGRVTELAGVMGRRSARSLDPTDRFDRDVREAFVAIEGPLPPSLVGLRVTVGFLR